MQGLASLYYRIWTMNQLTIEQKWLRPKKRESMRARKLPRRKSTRLKPRRKRRSNRTSRKNRKDRKSRKPCHRSTSAQRFVSDFRVRYRFPHIGVRLTSKYSSAWRFGGDLSSLDSTCISSFGSDSICRWQGHGPTYDFTGCTLKKITFSMHHKPLFPPSFLHHHFRTD